MIFERLREEISKEIIGLDDVVRDLFLSFICRGHILLEGVPGLAKTTLAKTFSQCIGLNFSRIQGTPDLIPSDITGSEIYDINLGNFKYIPGPIFSNIVLVDEINRMSPKTQSALLEAMEENSVSVGKKTYPLPTPFMVIATQNPVEFEGVCPLPTSQLDRFMIKSNMDYLSEEDELKVLILKSNEDEDREINPILNPHTIEDIFKEVNSIYTARPILKYIRDIVVYTRRDRRVVLGASTRAAVQLLKIAKGNAYLEGRSYVIPDDVKNYVLKVLSHRILLDYEVEEPVESVLRDILDKVEVPKGDFRYH
ncbi:MAG TPA: MoxR family ATPase [Methanothermococcus okinawensis]|uniref:MoxR family ATPase n=1 Tax=Methanothermococcus okinawensis TaxID=155863 RepID=A0A832ZAT7_9EURY|nr:MoxR family ATPase [Methanothermococcus okinawensis]